MLRNAPLRLKLLLILLLPLLGFLILAGVFVVDNYKTLRDMDATVTASATAQKLSQLITVSVSYTHLTLPTNREV